METGYSISREDTIAGFIGAVKIAAATDVRKLPNLFRVKSGIYVGLVVGNEDKRREAKRRMTHSQCDHWSRTRVLKRARGHADLGELSVQ